jgi:hypothetical protein
LAWWSGSFGISIAPPPVYYPPPAYYPPPVYYTPPPAPSYAPPQRYAPPPGAVAGLSCYAGPYMCPMEHSVPAGTTCWCPDNAGGRAYGRAG